MSRNKHVAYIFQGLKHVISQHYNPIVFYTLNGKKLAINFGHDLPINRNNFPLYSDNLTRLAKFVRKYFGELRMIDVGANIGDSFALAGAEQGDNYLLIEGSEYYFNILSDNLAGESSATCVKTFVSDRTIDKNDKLVFHGGSARLEGRSSNNTLVSYMSLDDLVAQYSPFQNVNLVKIDTDGFDCKVIIGSTKTICEHRPVIFFEHDPHHLDAARENHFYIFEHLKNLDYTRLIFYDNFGYMIGVVPADDADRINDLMFYAYQRQGYYYDICCFNDAHSEALDCFVKTEIDFYNGKVPGKIY